MSGSKYSMAFTTGGLFHAESLIVALEYQDLKYWTAVSDFVIKRNLLQSRTETTLKRQTREIVSRLETLRDPEVEFLINASSQEQAYMLWLAVCRRYRFIADFAAQVLRERYISLNTDLSSKEFESFFNRQAEWHEELDAITVSTRAKLRQVLFKILREADLLTDANIINAALLTPSFVELVAQTDRAQLAYFPVFESDLIGVS